MHTAPLKEEDFEIPLTIELLNNSKHDGSSQNGNREQHTEYESFPSRKRPKPLRPHLLHPRRSRLHHSHSRSPPS